MLASSVPRSDGTQILALDAVCPLFSFHFLFFFPLEFEVLGFTNWQNFFKDPTAKMQLLCIKDKKSARSHKSG